MPKTTPKTTPKTPKAKRTFTINRKTWRCGDNAGATNLYGEYGKGQSHGKGETYLLNSQGYMCCLGQIAQQCGFEPAAIRGKAEPRDVEGGAVNDFLRREIRQRDWNGRPYQNTELAASAMAINDDDDLTHAARERDLRQLFKANGYKLRFTGEY